MKAAPRFRWFAMATLLLAAFMELLDVTIVNVAIPSLQHDLNITYSTIQWMVAGYTLAFAVALVSGGRLGDIFGRKKIFMGGMVVFMLASLGSGIAQSADWLIVARLVQGLAAAMMMPQVLANMVVLFPDGKERLLATGMYGGVAGLATVGGPLIGGLLLQNNLFGFSWRNIFFINIPVGIVSLIAAAKFLPESKSPNPLKVDWVGTTLLTLALLLLLFPIIQGRELNWPLWGYIMMASSVPLLVAFWLYEKYKDAKDGSPLIILDLFKQRAFIAGIVIFIFFFGAMSAYFLLSTLFMQEGLGFTPLQAGLANVPFSIGIALGAGLLVNLLMRRLGRLVLVMGGALLALGLGAWVVTLNLVGTSITGLDMIPATLIAGTGMGLLIASLFNFVLAGVKQEHAGSASGILSTMQEVGSSLGIAILGVLFFNLLGTNALGAAQSVETQIRSDLSSLHLPAAAEQQLIGGFNACFNDRANAKDQTQTPESCTLATGQLSPQMAHTINQILQTNGDQANKDNFLTTFRRTLYYQIGLIIVVVGLIPLLPKKAPTGATVG